MEWFVRIGLLLLVGAVSWYLANRLGRLAGERGWVYNKHNPRPSGLGIPRLIDEIYQPSIEHVIEQEKTDRIRADQSESGDRPDPGGDREGDRTG